jgi:hypothetical protein
MATIRYKRAIWLFGAFRHPPAAFELRSDRWAIHLIVRDDGENLVTSSDYIKEGMRDRARPLDFCSATLPASFASVHFDLVCGVPFLLRW